MLSTDTGRTAVSRTAACILAFCRVLSLCLSGTDKA